MTSVSDAALRGGAPGYHVLLLHSESRLVPSVVRADRALRSTLEARSPRPVHFYTEFLDLNALHGASAAPVLRELLRVKYRGRPIDLVVAQGQLAVPLVLDNRLNLFSGAPVVFVAVEPSTFADLSLVSAVTGTWRHRGWRETLDLARRLHPGTRRAVVIAGSSEGERLWVEAARQQLAASAGPIEVSYLVDRSFDEILEAIAGLPEDAVVLVGPFLRDGTGRDFPMPAGISRMVAAARVPCYGLTEGVVGSGVIGGYVVSFEAHGKAAGELAVRVLAGEWPSPTVEGTTVPMFDDRQLERWRIDRRLLPAGSVVLFREPSLWERSRRYVGAMGGKLVPRAPRRRARLGVADRLRFEVLLSELSAALASCPAAEIDREIDAGLRRVVEDLGTERAILWLLDDRVGGARVTHSCTRAGAPVAPPILTEGQFPWVELIRDGHVLRVPDGAGPADEPSPDERSPSRTGTRSGAVAPLIDGGEVRGGLWIGAAGEASHWPDELMPRLRLLADIFANALGRQRAERAARESARDIRDLAGRLMTAQEDERQRIARELHDGVNQDLASLSIALSALEDGLPEGTTADQRQEVTRLQARTVELANAIRQLSHELHPGILQYSGLAPALRSHCREFGSEHGLAVSCRADDDLGTVPADIALCLYRVTQEALRNAARHAKASHVWVDVARDGDDLALTIRDDGSGFDPAAVRDQGGLGLISLGERVRFVGGRLAIDTEPQRGTEIRVTVPLR